jgi:hypothetical protein
MSSPDKERIPLGSVFSGQSFIGDADGALWGFTFREWGYYLADWANQNTFMQQWAPHEYVQFAFFGEDKIQLYGTIESLLVRILQDKEDHRQRCHKAP